MVVEVFARLLVLMALAGCADDGRSMPADYYVPDKPGPTTRAECEADRGHGGHGRWFENGGAGFCAYPKGPTWRE